MAKDARRERRLLLASLAVIALAVLVGGLFLGARMRAVAEIAPAAAATSAATARTAIRTSSPRPTATRSLGPDDHGSRAWDALTGGECLRAFPSAWRLRYEVVACRTPHAAQLARTVTLPDGAYPGRTGLKARLGGACQAAVRLPAASQYADIRISSSYPTAARWARGDRTAYCFVSRAGGGTLTGSLAPAR